MPKAQLPSYKNPPVVEVVWSVQFAPLAWLTAAHTGILWSKLRADYPECSEQAPVAAKDEPEDLLGQKPTPTVTFSPKPPLPRQWFVAENGNDLIQIQSDRFSVNWRKVKDDDEYPRFAHMKDTFRERWGQFVTFAKECGDGPPRVQLIEMTYVNHIFQGEGWSQPSDIGSVLRVMLFEEKRAFLPSPETVGCQMTFNIKGTAGRLHVVCRHARTIGPNPRDVFRLELTARGRAEEPDTPAITSWFTDARTWIDRGFQDLTGREIQETVWEKES